MGLFGPAWNYRGKDRRLLIKTYEGLRAIRKRDQLAAGDRKTQALSTRDQIIPLDDVALQAAYALITDRMHQEINRTRT